MVVRLKCRSRVLRVVRGSVLWGGGLFFFFFLDIGGVELGFGVWVDGGLWRKG